MYKIIYRNILNNTLIEEYCFWDKEEKRRMCLTDQKDTELVFCERLKPCLWSKEFWKTFWLCLINTTTYKERESNNVQNYC